MKRISTHVLDTAQGKPAGNVPVRLDAARRPASGCFLVRCAPMGTAGAVN